MNKRVCVFTGTRAEYGLLRPLLIKLRDDDRFDLSLVVSGSHFSAEFGFTYREIERDGFRIDEKVEMLLSSDSTEAITASLGLCVIGCGKAFEKLRPDLVVLLGDRYECLGAATAAAVSAIPIAHIHGGEKTEGALDESFRHAITKLAFLHFTSASEYRNRIIQMGENPSRVFVSGALGLDNVLNVKLKPAEEILSELGIPGARPLFLVTFHPETASPGHAREQFMRVVDGLRAYERATIVYTKSNADEGGRLINSLIEEEARKSPERVFCFASLGTVNYLSLAGISDAVIGNSSSGIIEIPSLGVPTIDIGDRQKGRLCGYSVIHAECVVEDIKKAISVGLSDGHRKLSEKRINPYGDGMAASRIISTLAEYPLVDATKKSFYDLPLPECL